MNDEDTVTLSRSEYEELQDAKKWMDALDAAGVDNWEGIDYAQEIYRG